MIKNVPYKEIEMLIKAFFDSYPEDAIVQKLSHVKERGYLTKKEFLEIGMWKSARPKRHYEKNSSEEIKEITSKAFKAISESQKIKILTKLHGVAIPTASAILAIIQPEKYGVIDIRVWQTLYYYGIVDTNSDGMNFSIGNWLDLTLILRNLADKINASPRAVERAIFIAHSEYQIGTLYTNNKSKSVS